MKHYYIKADTNNGCHIIDDCDEEILEGHEIIGFRMFMNMLPEMEEKDRLITSVIDGSPEYNELKKEYGIKL